MTADIMEQKYQGPHTIKNIHFAKDGLENHKQTALALKRQKSVCLRMSENKMSSSHVIKLSVQFSTTTTNITSDTKKSIAHS